MPHMTRQSTGRRRRKREEGGRGWRREEGGGSGRSGTYHVSPEKG